MSAISANGPDNEHMSVAALRSLLADDLAWFEQAIGQRISVEPLGKLKSVADATTKMLLRTTSGQPAAVIVCSRPLAPELIARGTQVAEAIAELIGDPYAGAIIRPIRSGYADGCSYVILPHCREFSRFKPLRIIQQLRMRRPLLRWLCDATAAAAGTHSSGEDAAAAYASVLQHLQRQELFTDDMQLAIRQSLQRLESGRWQPRHAFDHNDLWMGNVMLPGRFDRSAKTHYPFVLIDWAGANSKGFGIYDLVRLARALKLSNSEIRRQLIAHAAALRCDLQDTRGHLFAALGRLHQHLEYFPEPRFVQTAQACWTTWNRGGIK